MRSVGRAGFTVVELIVVVLMLMGILATVAMGIRSGHDAAHEMRRRAVLTRMAGEYLDRLFRIEFGGAGDARALPAQLDELFDDDDVLGSATLCSLRLPAGEPGHSFQLANFPYGGIWEVQVSADLNHDGDEEDDREDRDDLLRIDILYDQVLVLETLRSAPPG